MNFSYYIAKRYLFSKSKNNAINIITIIAAIGVFAGALALFIVLSGFSGLKSFSVQFTNDIDPDLKILPATGKVIKIDSYQLRQLHRVKGIEVFTKVIEERVLLSYEKRSMPAFIKGVDSSYNKVTSTDKSVIAGRWFSQDIKHNVVIGNDIARKLSIGVSGYGDILQLSVPKPGKGIITNPKKAFNSANSIVVGVYSINDELNGKYVFSPYKLAQELLGLNDDEVSGIGLRLKSKAKESKVIEEVKSIFNQQVLVKDRVQLNDELYKMLNTENLAVYLIFTLVLIIALFNVGGAIVMAILDKRENIKTLFNLGAEVRKIKRIFFLQGALLTFFGGTLGLFIGIVAVLLQSQYGFIMITETLPYPVQLKFINILVVFVTIMVLGLTASYIGSTRISKLFRN